MIIDYFISLISLIFRQSKHKSLLYFLDLYTSFETIEHSEHLLFLG